MAWEQPEAPVRKQRGNYFHFGGRRPFPSQPPLTCVTNCPPIEYPQAVNYRTICTGAHFQQGSKFKVSKNCYFSNPCEMCV